jgi:two-component system, OmpR family, response regulator
VSLVTGDTLGSGASAGLTADAEAVVDDVAVVRWPAESRRRDELARERRARLLVVAADEMPPAALDDLEDWVRASGDPVEVYVRKERLRRRQSARAPVVLDDDGLLRRGARWVALSPRELEVATVLLGRPGALVKRAELLAAVRPGASGDDRRVVDTVVHRLHRRIAPLGLTVHTVRASGYLLDVGELPD